MYIHLSTSLHRFICTRRVTKPTHVNPYAMLFVTRAALIGPTPATVVHLWRWHTRSSDWPYSCQCCTLMALDIFISSGASSLLDLVLRARTQRAQQHH